ncbi:hypothetical protein KGF57_001824 [Candida theae]|uniref:CBS domain-containing protein n=1 Tax=Candida theae TaxID=1198502 RepID=A0AAD5FZE4_9ASCO|nr:uncharacterized protein KGF57_001824 [Candida theae]KAI5960892.1 hypothetical protein KGF57_001824 [Candida theae]
MSNTPPTTPANTNLFTTRDYRGATIEDLNIPQAISTNPTSSIYEAIEIGYEYEFTYLPVIHELNKRLLGVVNLEQFKTGSPQQPQQQKQQKQENRDQNVQPIVFNYMLWFNPSAKRKYEQEILHKKDDTGSKSQVTKTTPKTKILKPRGKRYSVLTPYSPLEDLASFFNRGNYFAIVTNDSGNFVYGVVTPQDLLKYEQSRPKL